MIHVLGISGKAGSGKDTVFEHIRPWLHENYTPLVYHVSFASPLKNYARQYFPKLVDVVKKDETTRLILQGIGQMLRSEVSDDYWIDQARSAIAFAGGLRQMDREHANMPVVCVITDVRYKNEAEAFRTGNILNKVKEKERGFTGIFRITGRTSLEGAAAQHASETDLDSYTEFNQIYENTSSLEDLLEASIAWTKSSLTDQS